MGCIYLDSAISEIEQILFYEDKTVEIQVKS